MSKRTLIIILISGLIVVALGGAYCIYKNITTTLIVPQKITESINTGMFVVIGNGDIRFFSYTDKNFWEIDPKVGDKKVIFETITDEFCPNIKEVRLSPNGEHALSITTGSSIDTGCDKEEGNQPQKQSAVLSYLGIINFEKKEKRGLSQSNLFPVWSEDSQSILTVAPKDNKVRELRKLDIENLENWQTIYTYQEGEPTLWPEGWHRNKGLILLTRKESFLPPEKQKKTLFLLDTKTNTLRELTSEVFLSNLQLSPGGNFVFYTALNQGEQKAELKLLDLGKKGLPKTLLKERYINCIWGKEETIFCAIVKKNAETKQDENQIVKLNTKIDKKKVWPLGLSSYENIIAIASTNEVLYLLSNQSALYEIEVP